MGKLAFCDANELDYISLTLCLIQDATGGLVIVNRPTFRLIASLHNLT